MARLRHWLIRRWRRPTAASRFLLTPPALAFGAVVRVRRRAYRRGWLRVQRLPVPVVVVGNPGVGGSGKTPLVIHLVTALRRAGWSPGVVSRGYGGTGKGIRRLTPDADPREAGDEPALIQWAAECPVAVGAERAAAAGLLLDDCDIVVADDGLQHYALGRDVEIALVDAATDLGNGRLLPAGPLREPANRLAHADFVVARDGERAGAWRVDVRPGDVRRVDGTGEPLSLADFRGTAVHGVAGIAVPERFFGQLERAGLVVERHAHADHHPLDTADLAFGDERPILMTRKDAVKCRSMNDARLWYVDTGIIDRHGLADAVAAHLNELQLTGTV